MDRKRKVEDANVQVIKKPKRDPIRQYEQDRILLENFVKYGILSDKPIRHNRDSAVNVKPPTTPISPIRSPKRINHTKMNNSRPGKSIEPFVRGIYRNQTSTPKPVYRLANSVKENNSRISPKPVKIWRPWLETKSQAVSCLGSTKRTPTKSPGYADDTHVVPNVQSRSIQKPAKPEVQRKPFTAEVTRWNTTSPEFFNSFKHPVKLMYPRSKAVDYKFQDAQQLLQAFPVQAVIGFYDDDDDCEKPLKNNNINRQRHLPVKKQIWSHSIDHRPPMQAFVN